MHSLLLLSINGTLDWDDPLWTSSAISDCSNRHVHRCCALALGVPATQYNCLLKTQYSFPVLGLWKMFLSVIHGLWDMDTKKGLTLARTSSSLAVPRVLVKGGCIPSLTSLCPFPEVGKLRVMVENGHQGLEYGEWLNAWLAGVRTLGSILGKNNHIAGERALCIIIFFTVHSFNSLLNKPININ